MIATPVLVGNPIAEWGVEGVIWAIHRNARSWNDIPVKKSLSGPWKNIISIRQLLLHADIDLKNAVSAVWANGKNIQFWLDSWADPLPLYVKFPDLFKVDSNKQCLVEDRVGFSDAGPLFIWAWVRASLDVNECHQLQQLESLIESLAVNVGVDRWCWKYDANGSFNVASIKKILSSVNRDSQARAFEWNNWVPKKVAIVAWRADMERLPTKCALSARNIPVQDQFCVLCGEYEETSEHLFAACHFAQSIWLNIADWCRIPPIITFGFEDLLSLHEISPGSSKKRKIIHAVVLVAVWSIWKLRNEIVFRNGVPNTTKTLDEIKSMAYLWIKNRAKMVSMSWEEWGRFSLTGL
ncbi:uncharacterized protein LOC110944385 [Helianthus annuus]|uniref:uncharacterized protein LOC110944385 n=1 Tax=Helianthus annuus TaxID=4232 RepID=UPI000B8F1EEF|nr:uncharacterized protein LOC110944385 [Helianthus annuus]